MPRGEEPDVRSAEIERIADRLAFADDDVGAHRARRLDEAKRHGFGEHGDEQRAIAMAGFRNLRQIAQIAEDVGRLHDDARERVVDARDEIFNGANVRRHGLDFVFGKARDGAHDLGVMRMQPARKKRLAPLRQTMRHEHGFGGRGGAVIHGGVGDIHACQQQRPGSGTRRDIAACPGRFRADRACSSSGIPSVE